MPLTDLEAEELGDHRPHSSEPDGFGAFWRRTLAGARSPDASIKAERVTAQHPLSTVGADDVHLRGWNGEPVAAWLPRPRDTAGRLPVVVTSKGYGGVEDCPPTTCSGPPQATPAPSVGGGRSRPRAAALAAGASQGGGLALPGGPSRRGPRGGGHAGRHVPVPLAPRCRDLRRRSVPGHRHAPAPAQPPPHGAGVRHPRPLRRRPLTRRAPTPTLFGVGLTDPACPPSMVCAAFNQCAGRDRSTTVWPFGDHGDYGFPPPVQPARLRGRGLARDL
ncbi:Acetyl xylan esterase [Actinobacteria bacterium OV450]|nr:Acetyl xylan esterase [Actinobacteria bacterium OV450]